MGVVDNRIFLAEISLAFVVGLLGDFSGALFASFPGGVCCDLRVRFETRRGPLGVPFGMDERPEEWALRLLRWRPKPLITRSAKGFETDS